MHKDKNIWNTEPRDLSKEENNGSCIKMPSSTTTRGVIMWLLKFIFLCW